MRAAKKRGEEVPRTDTPADYRQDMAQIARVQDWARGSNKESDPFRGETPRRYYRSFDRGAARYAAKQNRRAGSRP